MDGEGLERAQRFLNRTTNVLTLGALTAMLTLSATNTLEVEVTSPTVPAPGKPATNER